MVRSIRVVQVGLGAMGSGIAEVMARRDGLEVVGAVDPSPDYCGKDLSEVLQLEHDVGQKVQADMEEVLSQADADICIICTFSFLHEVRSQIIAALQHGCDVITIAEEMAYPRAAIQGDGEEIHRLALAEKRTVLGTGINPGFVLDTLLIALTAACTDIERIKARRVNDLSPFGPTVMRTQGVGATPEEFADGLQDGSIVGHVGFPQSMYLVASALGWELDEVKEERKPIIAEQRRTGSNIVVEPGMVAGCNHTARGLVDGEEVLVLEHPQQVEPGAAGVDTGDYVDIEGTPGISMAIKPEIPGGIGTIATAVNMIAPVLSASPGLKTMIDLPLPRAVLGDVRETVKQLQVAHDCTS